MQEAGATTSRQQKKRKFFVVLRYAKPLPATRQKKRGANEKSF